MWLVGLAKLLLEGKAITPDLQNIFGDTPLARAAAFVYDGVVKPLLKCRKFPNMANMAGRTPLWLAAEGGHVFSSSTTILLGREDVNPDTQENYGRRTPLSWAAAVFRTVQSVRPRGRAGRPTGHGMALEILLLLFFSSYSQTWSSSSHLPSDFISLMRYDLANHVMCVKQINKE